MGGGWGDISHSIMGRGGVGGGEETLLGEGTSSVFPLSPFPSASNLIIS